MFRGFQVNMWLSLRCFLRKSYGWDMLRYSWELLAIHHAGDGSYPWNKRPALYRPVCTVGFDFIAVCWYISSVQLADVDCSVFRPQSEPNYEQLCQIPKVLSLEAYLYFKFPFEILNLGQLLFSLLHKFLSKILWFSLTVFRGNNFCELLILMITSVARGNNSTWYQRH